MSSEYANTLLNIVSCALWVRVEFVLLEHYVMLVSLDRDLEFWL